ncbi:MAG: ThuA domain-containing protein [Chthoniobacteraceae bacterium]
MPRFLPLFLALAVTTASSFAADKKVAILIAGRPSHGPGEHEHNAGVQLLAKCLKEGAADRLEVITKLNAQWPTPDELAKADTILIYSDGGGGHPALQDDRLNQLGEQMKRGAGFVCLHYAVEVPKDKAGKQFLEWLGGYFETHWSVNPHWDATFKNLPKHPISNGVQPFGARDEWYYHMRFPEGMEGVTPILSDLPPADTLNRGDGPHSGNPAVRESVKAGKPQHVAWAAERKDGGRGFGFTGGHFHKGWANDSQRKVVLNAILWTAKAEVPAEGVQSTVTPEDLAANMDPKGK